MADEPVITRLDRTQTVGADKWIAGYGPKPAEIMIIGEKPTPDDSAHNAVFHNPSSDVMRAFMRKAGFNDAGVYYTNAVKFVPPGKRAINAGDLKLCKPVLMTELAEVQPKLIICLGANALKMLLGKDYKFSDYRGVLITSIELNGTKVFATNSPSYLARNPGAEDTYLQDWQKLAQIQRGDVLEADATEVVIVQTAAHLKQVVEEILARTGFIVVSVDCEWNGTTWMDKEGYLRSTQFAVDIGKGYYVEWTLEGGKPGFDNPGEGWKIMKYFLEHPRVGILGQNVISDGQWLLTYGVDIRSKVVYDTMLAEHTAINETGPFGLEELTMKYTSMGRYDLDLAKWVKDNKKLCEHGYGMVPRELLIPYGVKDVDAPLRIAQKQLPHLDEFTVPRGIYTSLWDTVLATQRILYELESTGLVVDTVRLKELNEAYTTQLVHNETQLKIAAEALGLPDFNHRSTPQVRTLIFDKLGMMPVKTTDGKQWGEYIMNQQPEAQKLYTASTDKNTLEILQDRHPIIRLLLNVRRLDTVVKYFLKDDPDADESTTGGGIASKIWPDGRLHTHFSQLSDTGRFRHSKPNSANWPKKAEGYMADIFGGKDKVPPGLRTIIVPPPGHVLMEADFVQAELFVLAALSGDRNMMDALSTPGKDLHDLTAITAFGLKVLGADNQLVSDAQMQAEALKGKKSFEEFQQSLTYVDQRGKRMSRSEFKSGIRVSAKNLNFGIPYGRGARDIARQVKGETGCDTPLAELENDIQKMMDAWKEETYPAAWRFMQECAEAVRDPGYIINPWGRKRRFPKTDREELIMSMQREAQNYPIQSTVADTCMIAMQLMVAYRSQHGLNFKICNQIHDAIMVQVPENEIEATEKMFRETMGSIKIPLRNKETLTLGVDIEVLERWGVKRK